MEKILVLTTIGGTENLEQPEDWPLDMKDRSVGWYPVEELERVKASIAKNMGDLYECGYYPWAVIEETWWGTYPHIENIWWFRFDEEKKGYFPCDPPAWARSTCNFGLG